MAQLLVKDLLNDIYKKCGNATRDQLSIEIVLTWLYDELNKRVKQLELSEQNQLLKSVVRPIINELEQAINIEDFGTPVAVHLMNPIVDSSTIAVPLEIINFNALPQVGSDARLACSIYGTPPIIRFSRALKDFQQWQIKFWYEPDGETVKGLDAIVAVQPQFRPLVTSNVVKNVLPYAEISPELKSGVLSNILTELPTWEDMWDRDINAAKMYGNNKRTPFRAGVSRQSVRRWNW